MNWSKPRTSLISSSSFRGAAEEKQEVGEEEQEEERQRREDVYLFRAGRVPPYRQMFYQYGDLLLPAAQDIIASSSASECGERAGWFVPGTEDRLREALTKSINYSLARQRGVGKEEVEQEQEEMEVTSREEDASQSQEEDGD